MVVLENSRLRCSWESVDHDTPTTPPRSPAAGSQRPTPRRARAPRDGVAGRGAVPARGPRRQWRRRAGGGVDPAARPLSQHHGVGVPRHARDGDQVEGGVGHHVHAQPPGAVRDEGQDHAEEGEPGELLELAVGRPNSRPSITTAATMPSTRAADDPVERREQPGQPPQEQAPEEELFHERGPDHGEDGDDHEAAAVGATGQLLGGAR